MPAASRDASTVGIQALGARPGTLRRTFAHVFPPSRVTWTLPSSVPTQITLESSGDGAMLSSVVWNSAAVLSVTIWPPEFCCFFGSFVVRSGEITSQEFPKSRDRKSTLPPKYTVPGCSGVTAIGEFQLNRYLCPNIMSPTEPTRFG